MAAITSNNALIFLMDTRANDRRRFPAPGAMGDRFTLSETRS